VRNLEGCDSAGVNEASLRATLRAVQTVTIPDRFHGPPGSANGGYACGVAASGLAGTVEVTLHGPPPLQRPLRVDADGTTATVRDGDTLIATAKVVDGDIASPNPVTPSAAEAAAAAFDLDGYAAGHIYPGCFTCGPGRAPGDGLRIFPGPTGRRGLFAWPWTPDPSLFDGDALDPAVVWAALDCPGGVAWLSVLDDLGAIILGRLTADVRRAPERGERTVVGGWADEREGRKLHAGSAIWGADGEVLAAARSTWLVLTPEQAAAFGAATS
jgi:hypothetical protein